MVSLFLCASQRARIKLISVGEVYEKAEEWVPRALLEPALNGTQKKGETGAARAEGGAAETKAAANAGHGVVPPASAGAAAAAAPGGSAAAEELEEEGASTEEAAENLSAMITLFN